MKFKFSVSIFITSIITLTSIIIGYIGLNECIIGYVTFINRHYGILYGGDPVLVNISSGQLKGFHSTNYVSRDGRAFYEFLGIPFAQPPVGSLRFKPPVKVQSWNGTWDATGYGSKCWQFDPFIHVLSGDEDCLFLNVFTPKLSTTNEKLPVIVFIHGGLFMFGRVEMFRPEYIMDHDVVLVQIHYRLGAFGFLNVNEDIRGNMGLKDQVLALQWVQENIEHFGGDPSRVTLLGESAGASSIHMHMLSPLSKGLFHGAITMSASALNNWSFNPKPQQQAQLIGSKLGCPINDTKALTDCLKGLDALEIAQLFREINDFLHHRLAVFAPTIEHSIDEYTFLSDSPRNLISRGQILTKVPWIMGSNSDEGLIYAIGILRNSTTTQLLNSNWSHWAPTLFAYEDFDLSKRNNISQAILDYYMKGQNFSLDTLKPFVEIFSDSCFYAGVAEAAKVHKASSVSKDSAIYLYYYSYQAKNAVAQIYLNMVGFLPVAFDGILSNLVRWFKSDILALTEFHYGAGHADELTMLFQFPRLIGVVYKDSPDYKFSKMLIKTWVSFATTGKPELDSGLEWPQIELNSQPFQYMELDNNPKVISEPFTKGLQFWKSLNIDIPSIQPRR